MGKASRQTKSVLRNKNRKSGKAAKRFMACFGIPNSRIGDFFVGSIAKNEIDYYVTSIPR